MAAEKILRIQHQSKSDPSSSNDGVSMARNDNCGREKTFPENIELKNLSLQNQEDLGETFKNSSRGTAETNFSSKVAKSFEKQESSYKRSRSYHGKSLKGFIQSCGV